MADDAKKDWVEPLLIEALAGIARRREEIARMRLRKQARQRRLQRPASIACLEEKAARPAPNLEQL